MDIINQLSKNILNDMIYINNAIDYIGLSEYNYKIVCDFIINFDIHTINKYNINPERVILYFVFYNIMLHDIIERSLYIDMNSYIEIKSKIDMIEDKDILITLYRDTNNEYEKQRKKQYNAILTLLNDIVLVNLY